MIFSVFNFAKESSIPVMERSPLNFSMGFIIIAPYMEFLHLNWCIAEWFFFYNIKKWNSWYIIQQTLQAKIDNKIIDHEQPS